MNRLGLHSLKVRMLLSMLGLLLLTITLMSLAVVHSQRDAAYRQAESELRSLGGMVVTNTTAPLLFGDAGAAELTLRGLSSLPDIRVAVVFDAAGEVFSRFGAAPPAESRLPPGLVRERMQAGVPTLQRDEDGLYAFMPVSSEGELVGLVFLANGMNGLTARLREFTAMVVLASALSFALGTLVILWLQGHFTRPLQQMIGVIQHITADRDYSRRTPLSGLQEFGALSASFNHMIAEVEARGQQLESINADLEDRVRARTEELESALRLANEGNRAKSEFLAVMSHEVRTPLNGIIGFLEVLKTRPLEEGVRDIVASLDRSSQTLLELLNEILDFSKLDANKIELECYELDLRELLRSAIDTYRPLATRKGLRLDLDCRLDENAFLGDATRLRQILQNFVSNAIKFTDAGGVRVVVEARDHHSDALLTFSVQDSGIGIPAERLQDIFSPFVQVDSSITRRYGGTGLGLAISKQLIRLMDGQFGVESEPGRGSRFWFSVPMARPSLRRDAEPAAPEPALRHRPGRILIAEDNPLNQEVVLSLLGLFGHSCDVAATGAEALRLAAAQPYDLIFMDYHMPEMDGLEACRRLRELGGASPNAATPIIALTADIQPQVNKDFRRAGANATLLKPFKLAGLEACLNQWMPAGEPAAGSSPVRGAAAGGRDGAGAGETPLLNSRTLDEIIGLSPDKGPELLTRLAGIFSEQVPALTGRIRQALADSDADGLFRAAHSLKSSAANIGAERLSELSRTLEQLARDRRLPADMTLMEQMDRCGEQTLSALQRALDTNRTFA